MPVRFTVDSAFWRDKKATMHYPIHCWRWEVGKVQRALAELVDAHYAPSRMQCTLTVDHEFLIFSTVHLKATGNSQDVAELGRLIEDMKW